MTAACDHSQFDWPAAVPVREWQFQLADRKVPTLLQWCRWCGALREVNGTEIGRWTTPEAPLTS